LEPPPRAALNVAINLPSIGDRELAGSVQTELGAAVTACETLSRETRTRWPPRW